MNFRQTLGFGSSRHAALAAGSKIAETRKGDVEYAVAGFGPTILVIHGSHGGYDQGLLFGRDFVSERFGILAPSRPGFLRTPLATGPSFAQAADAMIALLDALLVRRVIVMAISGGGLTALELARRHPNRVAALVLASSVTRRFVPEPDRMGGGWFNAMRRTSPGLGVANWMARTAPRRAAERMLRTESRYDSGERQAAAARIAADPARCKFLLDMLAGLAPFAARRAGLDNELAEAAGYDENPDWSGIAAPTLIVHGRNDGDVPFDVHAAYAAATIPNAETVFSDSAFHLLPLCDDYPEIRAAMIDFLRRHGSRASRIAP